MRIKLFFVHGCFSLLCSDTVIRDAAENGELVCRADERRWGRVAVSVSVCGGVAKSQNRLKVMIQWTDLVQSNFRLHLNNPAIALVS